MRLLGYIPLLAGLVLAGCAQTTPQRTPAEAAAKLPPQIGAFRKGNVAQVSEGGTEVGYSTTGRIAAGATVEINRPGTRTFPDGAGSSEAGRALAQTIAEQTLPAPGRSVTETGRFTVPADDPALVCASTSGRFGRESVQGILCAGGLNGNLVQLRATQPGRASPPADLRGFAAGVATSLRSP
jgi:hypothetical protein